MENLCEAVSRQMCQGTYQLKGSKKTRERQSYSPAETGYKAAFKEFEERYGDADVIAQTYIKKALDWSIIKADNPKSLDEFAIFLRECQFAVEDVDAGRPRMEVVHSNEANATMAAKTGQIYAARTGAGTALPIVPVRVKAKSSDKFVETYAFLDSGSTATFCSDRVLHLLGIEGKKTILTLSTLENKQKQTTREVRGLEISSLDGGHTIEFPPVFTQPSLPLSRADVPSEEDVTGWPHLRDLELERISSEVDL
ncbi:uncharacterized protein LOC127849123 [Dreissena polymorpha]|uniref:uncharacterized protein LOC127849123 n=1 Tax=Dreissena polymorpha TaxID=45954 RepID=UPI002264C2FB|nr:uncharacterized protein LOC127849123 [Dreissena polymorpha]